MKDKIIYSKCNDKRKIIVFENCKIYNRTKYLGIRQDKFNELNNNNYCYNCDYNGKTINIKDYDNYNN